MAAQRKRLVRHFIEMSAFTPESAISASSLPRAGFRLLARLQAQRAILTASDGKLYLDRSRWESLTATRHARAKVLLALVSIAALGVLAWVFFKIAT